MTVKIVKKVLGNWRVIVRFSLDYDKNSAVRNYMAPILESCGIKRRRTGTWESRTPHVDPHDAATQLSKVFRTLADPKSKVGAAGPHAELDHIWIYIDRV